MFNFLKANKEIESLKRWVNELAASHYDNKRDTLANTRELDNLRRFLEDLERRLRILESSREIASPVSKIDYFEREIKELRELFKHNFKIIKSDRDSLNKLLGCVNYAINLFCDYENPSETKKEGG